jgi:hypothetical protein
VRSLELAALGRLAPDPLGDDGDTAIDVVIPVGPRDADVVRFALEGIETNLRNSIGRVWCVAPHSVSDRLRRRYSTEVIDEEDICDPKTRALIAERFGSRAGWLTQQFVTLSAPEVTRADAVLVADADTVLIRPRRFRSGNTTLVLAAREFHVPYFEALARLWREPLKLPRCSFTAHHMCFMREDVLAMRRQIERLADIHWFEAIVRAYDVAEGAGFSDYELYGQWRARAHPDHCVISSMRNVAMPRTAIRSVAELTARLPSRVHSVSCHWHV